MISAPSLRILTSVALCLGASLLALAAPAQEADPPAPAGDEAAPAQPAQPPPITIQEIEESIRLINENTALDETTKSNLLAVYNRALDQVRIRNEHEQAAARFEEEIAAAPKQAEELAKSVQQPPRVVEIASDEEKANFTLVDYQQRLIEAQAALEAARQQVTTLEAEANRRTERRRELAEEQTRANTELQEVLAQAGSPPAEGESPETSLARQTLLRATRQALEAKLKRYETELRNFDIRRTLNLLSLRTDAAVRERRYQEERVKQLEAFIQGEQRRLAQQTATEAAQAGEDAVIPAASFLISYDEAREWIESVLEENRRLAGLSTGAEGVLAKNVRLKEEVETLQAELEELNTEYSDVQAMVEKARSSANIGTLLRTQKRALPNIREHERSIREREDELAAVDVALTELNIKRRPLSVVDDVIEDRIGYLEPRIPERDYAELTEFVRVALNDQKRIIDQLLPQYSERSELLATAIVREGELIDTTRQFTTFIDERVFWVQSGRVFLPAEFRYVPEALGWVLQPRGWADTVSKLYKQAKQQPIANGILVLVFAFLVGSQAKLRKSIRDIGKEAANAMCVSYGITIHTLFLTVVTAAIVPALLAVVAWRITLASDPTEFSRAVAQGLFAAAILFGVIELFRQVLRPGGLAAAHFGWPEHTLRTIRRHAMWLAFILVPAAFVTTALDWNGEEAYTESLGRLVFIVSQGGLFAFAFIVLREKGPIRRAQYDGLIPKSRWFSGWVYFAALAIPAVLILAAIAGYYYTASQLAGRLFITICLGLAILLVRGLVQRWLTLTHRRIAIAQYRERLMAPPPEPGTAAAEEEDRLDLSKTTVQTSRLTNSVLVFALLIGVWLIWSPVLPALAILERVEIWETTTVNEQGEEVATYITLEAVAFAALVGLLTAAAARNIPGILEIILHKRFALQAGERYALATVVRYIIVIGGVLWAADTIGFGWSKVQWLVAALSLGIGFGLQEIVANFISGIILLFERPIRVGDVVTIGTISGKVSRIRMRATTITDWDRKELVVPNKEFITGQIVNWSLSDEILRIVIPVGVAYGSDTEKVVDTLRRVAKDHPVVLDDPEPIILFKGFGDSSLNFELRVYCAHISDFIPVLHDMHMQVDRAFREQGIEISFPQRDLHIRSIRDIVRVSEDRAREQEPAYADIKTE